MDIGSPHNPFSSEFVEPARGGFIFENPSEFQTLLQRLATARLRAQLLGHHGAGKSTLLTDICRHLHNHGLSVARWQCRDAQPFLPVNWIADMRRAHVIAIDGGERLFPGLLWLVRATSRLLGKGLLVTVHRPAGFSLSIPVEASAPALAAKIERLTGSPLPADDLSQRLARHNNNARELFFELYLEYEKAAVSPNSTATVDFPFPLYVASPVTSSEPVTNRSTQRLQLPCE